MRIRFKRDLRDTAERIGGVSVPYAPARRTTGRWRWYMVLLIVFGPVLYLLCKVLASWATLTADGSVSLPQFEVRAPGGGYIDHLAGPVGTEVKAGEIVAALRSPELDTTLEKLNLERNSLSSAQATARAGSTDAELAALRQTQEWRQQRLAGVRALFAQGAATEAEVNEAFAATAQAAHAVATLERVLRPSSNAADSETMRLTREVALVEQRRASLSVRADMPGRVIDVFATPGEFVGAGQPLLLVGRVGAPSITAFVKPAMALSLAPGTQATVRFPDGSKALATVTELPRLTRRLPADLVDQYGLRPMTVVMTLTSTRPWSGQHLVHGLPVTVRFHYVFETALHRLAASRDPLPTGVTARLDPR